MPLVLSIPPMSLATMSEYEKELRMTMKEEKINELTELNERTFGM